MNEPLKSGYYWVKINDFNPEIAKYYENYYAPGGYWQLFNDENGYDITDFNSFKILKRIEDYTEEAI